MGGFSQLTFDSHVVVTEVALQLVPFWKRIVPHSPEVSNSCSESLMTKPIGRGMVWFPLNFLSLGTALEASVAVFLVFGFWRSGLNGGRTPTRAADHFSGSRFGGLPGLGSALVCRQSGQLGFTLRSAGSLCSKSRPVVCVAFPFSFSDLRRAPPWGSSIFPFGGFEPVLALGHFWKHPSNPTIFWSRGRVSGGDKGIT